MLPVVGGSRLCAWQASAQGAPVAPTHRPRATDPAAASGVKKIPILSIFQTSRVSEPPADLPACEWGGGGPSAVPSLGLAERRLDEELGATPRNVGAAALLWT